MCLARNETVAVVPFGGYPLLWQPKHHGYAPSDLGVPPDAYPSYSP